MKFGLIFPNYKEYCTGSLVTEAVKAAEEAGFDCFFVWDHYMLPWSNRTFEAWMLLSHLAAATRTIRLGTCVTPIPLRPPAMLAKMVSTADVLSNGRVVVGVGAGWHQPEFRGFGSWEDSRTRVAKTREGVELMTRLWTEDVVDYEGKHYSAKGAVLEPKPVQKPHPPLWFGTRGEYMQQLAAMYGDGWIPVSASPAEFASGVKKIKGYLQRMGGISKQYTFALDADPSRDGRGYVKAIEEYGASGCNHYAVAWEYPVDGFIKKIRWFGRDIIPSFT